MKGMTFLIVLPIVALLIFMPLLVIWALNTLFALSIPFTFWTWVVVVVLCIVFNYSKKG